MGTGLVGTGEVVAPVMRPAPREPAKAPLRLVLLVGRSLQPDSALRAVLARDGLRCVWLTDLHQAAQALHVARADAIVVDQAALLQSGAPALDLVNGARPCPVIAVGNATTEVDDLLALACGATTFLAQPFSAERLLAQLQALLRIADGGHAATAMEEPSEGAAAMIACWQVDRINNLLHRQDRRIKLTNVQSTMLHTLLTAEGRLVSRGQLAAALPGGATLSSRAIDVYVWRLRRHLAQAGVDDLTVNTVVGRGYRVSQQEARSTDSIPINA